MSKNLLTSYLSLFTSFGTIFCCALPALLVTLGLGATFAGLIGAFPQLIWLSENKIIIFFISGVLILISGLLQYFNRNAPCPIDPEEAKACIVGRKWARRILTLSVILWVIGFSFSFILPIFI